jgi:CRISPR/Cas system-associated endonuclease Cas1
MINYDRRKVPLDFFNALTDTGYGLLCMEIETELNWDQGAA